MVWDLQFLCNETFYAIIQYAINRIRLYIYKNHTPTSKLFLWLELFIWNWFLNRIHARVQFACAYLTHISAENITVSACFNTKNRQPSAKQ